MQSRPTIHDVALRAGVSIATVSRALRDVPSVRPRTVELVKTAARELGYQPNPLAAALRLNATATIGMIVPAISNPYYAALVEAVVRALQTTRREVLLSDSLDDPGIEQARVHALLDRRVDGLIIVPCDRQRSATAVATAAARIPTVQLDRVVDGVESDFVVGHDDAGISMIVQHLGLASAKALHFVSARASSSTGYSRLMAFRAATKGLVPRANEHLGEFTTTSGREAATRLLASGRPVSAIICGADVIALGVLQSLNEHGKQVPADVSVTGYDDIAFAEMANPPLTTIRQPVEDLAIASIARLDARLSNPANKTQGTLISPQLIVRSTTQMPN
ncbi:LacI family DNA-binding transcriptional regulator [Actinacidiphila soli]|uniref:LacI family DNA-binding transcriptional regulator n=1 Tax=Actinacidiphila soli TaxID=2487275 RepID=UPI000FCC19C0|nr:LacI family DNA-binding transcriptional regulator [Actinacidiphila soli]